ncbi:unnamed protein product [Pleuronectes platessa]|uniref:Uncharacterized protein n=1 Tax=Pleuronectes platessa TaxID=8262 RepID=A0A9N7U2Y7_PLEPL|nr:unnamed protein product [Pleuronectes platessa]
MNLKSTDSDKSLQRPPPETGVKKQAGGIVGSTLQAPHSNYSKWACSRTDLCGCQQPRNAPVLLRTPFYLHCVDTENKTWSSFEDKLPKGWCHAAR